MVADWVGSFLRAYCEVLQGFGGRLGFCRNVCYVCCCASGNLARGGLCLFTCLFVCLLLVRWSWFIEGRDDGIAERGALEENDYKRERWKRCV